MDKKTRFFAANLKTAALTASVLALCLASNQASAQIAEQTGIADPSRIGEQFQQDMIAPQVSPKVSVRELEIQGAPPGAENIRFPLSNVQLEGISAYPPGALERVYQDYLGQEVSLADVYRIASDLTIKYRNDGFILTRVVVPPQTIDGGSVRLQVVEGYVDSIAIQGPEGEGPALEIMRDYASQISKGGALNVRDLERQLLLISDLPGIEARSVLSPSRTQPGAADMLIIVDERDPWDAILSADNFGSRFLGPVQLSAAGTLNSWLGYNEAITAQFVVAPDSGYELAYGALSYEQPVGPWGSKLLVSGSVTDTEPGFTLDEFDVRGHSDLMTVQISHPFIRTRSENLTGRFLFDWRDVESQNNIEPTRKDRIRAIRAGGRYEFLDTLLGVAVNVVDVEISQGLNVFGSSDEGDANLTRAAGEPEFTKIEAEIQRLQRITDGVNLLLAGRGQWSANPLLSSEEFGVGGVNIGRAFDPSEIVGDDGIAGKIELQWTDPYALNSQYVDDYQLYSFFDAGRIWNQDATTSSNKSDTLTSAGAGVRVNFASDLEGGFAVAFPLNRDVQTQGDKDPRFYVNVSKRF